MSWACFSRIFTQKTALEDRDNSSSLSHVYAGTWPSIKQSGAWGSGFLSYNAAFWGHIVTWPSSCHPGGIGLRKPSKMGILWALLLLWVINCPPLSDPGVSCLLPTAVKPSSQVSLQGWQNLDPSQFLKFTVNPPWNSQSNIKWSQRMIQAEERGREQSPSWNQSVERLGGDGEQGNEGQNLFNAVGVENMMKKGGDRKPEGRGGVPATLSRRLYPKGSVSLWRIFQADATQNPSREILNAPPQSLASRTFSTSTSPRK